MRYAYEDGRLRRDYTLEFPFIVHDRKNVINVGGGGSWSDGKNSSVGDVTLLSFIASPVEAGTTKIYVFTGRNHSLDVDDSQFTAGFDAIMEQDRVIVENQRPEQIPLAIKEELHLGFPDAASVAYRRLLRGLENVAAFLPELSRVTVAASDIGISTATKGSDAMTRSSFKVGLGMFGSIVLMSMAGTPRRSADKPITIGLIMEARPEVEPWSLAWHDAAEAMKKKILRSRSSNPTKLKLGTREPVARQMLDAGANVLLLSTSCSVTSPKRWRRNSSRCRWE